MRMMLDCLPRPNWIGLGDRRQESRKLVRYLGVCHTNKSWKYEFTLLDRGWRKYDDGTISDQKETVGFHVVAKLDWKESVREDVRKNAESEAIWAGVRARIELERVRAEVEGPVENGEDINATSESSEECEEEEDSQGDGDEDTSSEGESEEER